MQHLKWFALLLLLLATRVQAQQSIIRVPAGSGYVEFAFDTHKISRDDLGHWIKLAPQVAAENFYLVPETLESCQANDPRYICGKGETPVNIHNAELNLQKMRRRIDHLQADRFPSQLSEVVSYLKRVQLFSLCRETHRLAFLTTGSVSDLEATCEDIDPKLACAPVLQEIRSSASQAEGARLARSQWANCMWFAFEKQFGGYPRAAWDSFLSAFGISEREVSTEDD
jgi:hypothetical protein